MKSKFRVILVGTEYELNLGAAARLMANFNQSPLYLVNPACEPIGFTARMHAKHAFRILEKAIVCPSLQEATKGCSLIVGTTGILRRHKNAVRHPLALEQLRERINNSSFAPLHSSRSPIALVFGPEGNGLCENDIKHCDLLVSIPASRRYPVLNLSHAMAIVLYALAVQSRRLKSARKAADKRELECLKKAFDRLVLRYGTKMLAEERARLAFRRMLYRAMPDETEVRSMLSVIHQALRELEKK